MPFTWHLTASSRYRPLPEVAADALQAAARAADARLAREEAQELAARLTELSPYPDADRGLARLVERRLAVLSNGTADGVSALVASAGLTQRFEHLLAVDSVRRYKPAPEAYGLAAEAFGVEARQLVLVSAHEWDVAGAQAAGLRGALVTRGTPVTGYLGHEPDIVVGELGELAEALGRFEAAGAQG